MNKIFTTKGWLVFLLVLAMIGFGVYIFIGFLSVNNTEVVVVEEVIPIVEEVIPEIKELCFEYSHKATEEELYEVKENIKIKIDADIVTGEKNGTQEGPDMTNGYQGTLRGTIKDGVLELVNTYSVDGATGKELEIYKVVETGLEKQVYVLMEEAGTDDILVPDMESELRTTDYVKVDCVISQ